MLCFLRHPAPLHALRLHTVDDALPAAWAELALAEAERNAELFVPAGTVRSGVRDRAGQVLVELFFPEVAVALQGAIAAQAPEVFAALGLPPLEVREVEVQLTRYGDGDFYAPHIDCDTPELADRAVAWLWYLHHLPRPFTGGEVRLYHSELRGGQVHADRSRFVEVEPRHNRLCFFDTRQLHEARPVHAPEGFGSGRFSVNGWIRVR